MEKLYTVKEAAKYLNLHPGTVRKLALAKRISFSTIPCGAVGYTYRFTESDLAAFVRVGAGAEQ